MNDRNAVHVFVLIDALGWMILDGQDFLQDWLPFRRPLRTVLGFSSGAIPSILTGVPPAQNGHWNLFYYDPEGSPFRWMKYLSFLPERVLDHRVTRKLLKELGRRVLGLGSQFECAVHLRRTGRTEHRLQGLLLSSRQRRRNFQPRPARYSPRRRRLLLCLPQ